MNERSFSVNGLLAVGCWLLGVTGPMESQELRANRPEPGGAGRCSRVNSATAAGKGWFMANNAPADLVLQTELDAIFNDRGLLSGPRPSVDREKLQHHLREALRLLHVDLDNENVSDTPRRWAESLVTLTSGYDFTDVKRLTTLFRKACSKADKNCQNMVVIGGTY